MPLTPGDVNVAIVDDHATSRFTLATFLKAMGVMRIDEASSVAEAEAALAANAYDIVFLDLNLQDGTGLPLLEKCRGDRIFDDTAFVIVSSESSDRTIIDALRMGATSYIVKPPSSESFAQHMGKVFKWLNLKRDRKTAQGQAEAKKTISS